MDALECTDCGKTWKWSFTSRAFSKCMIGIEQGSFREDAERYAYRIREVDMNSCKLLNELSDKELDERIESAQNEMVKACTEMQRKQNAWLGAIDERDRRQQGG